MSIVARLRKGYSIKKKNVQPYANIMHTHKQQKDAKRDAHTESQTKT